MFLVNEFEFNTNTYTSKNRQELESIYSRAHGIILGADVANKMPIHQDRSQKATMQF